MKKAILPLAALLFLIAPLLFADEAADLDSAFPLIARKLAKAEQQLSGKRVAVYGFDVIGRPTDSYGRYATEKLTHEIVDLGRFLVIERSRLDEILAEQNFSLSGAVDSATAARIGKLLSVDAVVTGTILVTEERIEFIARVIQSETGLILSSADVFVYTSASKAAPAGKAEPSVIAAPSGNAKEGALKIKPSKTSYAATEQVSVSWSGFPGNDNDWITLVKANEGDDSYGLWFYTYGEKSGDHVFEAVPPGEYELRVYLDWPAGGYEVKARVPVSVK
jgi:TolB-like protein